MCGTRCPPCVEKYVHSSTPQIISSLTASLRFDGAPDVDVIHFFKPEHRRVGAPLSSEHIDVANHVDARSLTSTMIASVSHSGLKVNVAEFQPSLVRSPHFVPIILTKKALYHEDISVARGEPTGASKFFVLVTRVVLVVVGGFLLAICYGN